MDGKIMKKEDGYRVLEQINSWINNVDLKTSFLLAFAAVFFGSCFFNDVSTRQTFTALTTGYTEALTFRNFIADLTPTLLLVSILILFCALHANLNSSSEKGSLLFFGTIAEMELSDYETEMLNIGDNELKKQLIEQIHTNSCICKKKFQRYNWGLRVLKVAIFLCVVSRFLQVILGED